MRLNQNMASLGIYQNYKKNLGMNSTALDRLSSGQKINTSKDNPNKLGQSETMRMQIRGLAQAQRNLQDGVSMMQTFDGALDTVGNALTRMKELTVQAGAGGNTEEDRETIQREIDTLKSHIDYTAKNAEFNGKNIIGDEGVTNNNYPNNIVMTVGANSKETMKIPTFNVNTSALTDENGNTLKDISVMDSEAIATSLGVIDSAIAQVSSIRGKYGAIQNRMETTAENMSKNIEVNQRAESSLRDSDVALEMAEIARTQILIDTSLALMVQSNNLPMDALKVLERVK
ncbi:MAG: flagellin [Clostridium sp.]